MDNIVNKLNTSVEVSVKSHSDPVQTDIKQRLCVTFDRAMNERKRLTQDQEVFYIPAKTVK